MRLWRANISVTEEKTFWVENNGFEIANPWELDTLGNYPWDTLGLIILEICSFQHEDV